MSSAAAKKRSNLRLDLLRVVFPPPDPVETKQQPQPQPQPQPHVKRRRKKNRRRRKVRKIITPTVWNTPLIADEDVDVVEEHVDTPFGLQKKPKERIMMSNPTLGGVPLKAALTELPNEVERLTSKISNIVEVPEEQINTFIENYTTSTKNGTQFFMERVAPVFLSFEEAMSISSIAMRDGLSLDNEVDLEISPLLEWTARLSTLEHFLNQFPLSEPLRNQFMRLCVSRAVDKCFTHNKFKNSLLDSTANVDNRVAGIMTSLRPDISNEAKHKLHEQQLKKAETVMDNLHKMAGAAKKSTTQRPKTNMSTTDVFPAAYSPKKR
jgi:hypothetical protein